MHGPMKHKTCGRCERLEQRIAELESDLKCIVVSGLRLHLQGADPDAICASGPALQAAMSPETNAMLDQWVRELYDAE